MNSDAPLPTAPPLGAAPIMRQRWSDVSFVHWRVDPTQVERFMPPGCRPDERDGSTWVGLIGFQMSQFSFFGGPRVPWLGDFPEINVRVYSRDEQGRRGVVFLSLEASHLIPVLVARAAFGLPYQWASMRLEHRAGVVEYETTRHGQRAAFSRFAVRPELESVVDDPLSHFLTARWGFHERHLGRSIYCRNEHEPWPLRRAQVEHLDDGLLEAAGFPGLAGRAPDSVLYASAVTTQFAAARRLVL